MPSEPKQRGRFLTPYMVSLSDSPYNPYTLDDTPVPLSDPGFGSCGSPLAPAARASQYQYRMFVNTTAGSHASRGDYIQAHRLGFKVSMIIRCAGCAIADETLLRLRWQSLGEKKSHNHTHMHLCLYGMTYGFCFNPW